MANILRIDSSARVEGSVTRDLLDHIEARLNGTVTRRDLGGEALPQIDGTWLASNFTPADQRDDAQKAALALSDTLIAELRAADTILIGLPLYNFSVPGSLKAWIDLICRAGETFNYTETGPVGLLEGKRAIVAFSSGGVPLGSEADFASGYLRFLLGFIGITDVSFISADGQATRGEVATKEAMAEIEKLAA